MAPCELELPAGFALGEAPVEQGDDRHEQGRLAARRALAALGVTASIAYDGTRPIVVGGDVAISITHGRRRAFAVAARVARLGIDLCDHDARLVHLADRFMAAERSLATSLHELAACFAAKEAALKALGMGLLDGGVFDDCAIHVVSLAPPRVSLATLELVLGEVPDGAIAVVYGHTCPGGRPI